MGTPSRSKMRLAVIAVMRGPGVRTPTRFRGSAPLRTFGGRFANGAKEANGFRQSELFAADAADEVAAANFAAGFKASINTAEFVPGDVEGFAVEHPTEDNAVTAEESAGEDFEGFVGSAGIVFRRCFLRVNEPFEIP